MSKAKCVEMNPEYLKGIDVSHYQGEIDWTQIDKDSIAFVYLKATEGNDYIDPAFSTNISSLNNEKIPFGVYHFFEPSKDAELQAEHFLKIIHKSKAKLPPVLDIEISQGVETILLHEKIEKWLKIVHKKSGKKPIIYTSKDFKETILKNKFDDYEFWIAEYMTKSLNDSWIIWQYTQTGKVCGINGFVDMNYLHSKKLKTLLK